MKLEIKSPISTIKSEYPKIYAIIATGNIFADRGGCYRTTGAGQEIFDPLIQGRAPTRARENVPEKVLKMGGGT